MNSIICEHLIIVLEDSFSHRPNNWANTVISIMNRAVCARIFLGWEE